MKKLAFIFSVTLISLTVVALIIVFSFGKLSTANLNTNISSSFIENDVVVARDQYGVVSIEADNRLDAAFAMGYVHAQERYFQMDLLRKSAAGELASIFGSGAINTDSSRRLHRIRSRAQAIFEQLPLEEQELLERYAAGANMGLSDLSVKPWEYIMLGVSPELWQPVDSLIVPFAMFFDLNDETAYYDHVRSEFNRVAPESLKAFLTPRYYRHDSPLVEFSPSELSIPSDFGLRQSSEIATYYDLEKDSAIGSNNWATNGPRTESGRAILANDMHLMIRVPNIWFRAQLNITNQLPVTGVTLPGAPLVVVGSNTRVAWGFTNSYGDWSDRIQLELSEDKTQYRTRGGMVDIIEYAEVIDVKNAEPVVLTVRETQWGPIPSIDSNESIRWLAHHPDAINLNLLSMENATNLDQAHEVCQRSGLPPQNCVVADAEGNIGWTIAGRIPKRINIDYRLPITWEIADVSWNGWLEPEEYPRIVNPENGAIWTANSKVVVGSELNKIGWGAYDLGARGAQIRDNLLSLDGANEFDSLAVAYDYRGVFYQRWAEHLTQLTANTNQATLDDVHRYVSQWDGLAAHDSIAFSVVFDFRNAMINEIYQRVGEVLIEHHETTLTPRDFTRVSRGEDPVWLLLQEQPEHWLPSQYTSWREFQQAVLLRVVNRWVSEDGTLGEQAQWHRSNDATIDHPLAVALPDGINQLLRGLIHMEDIPLNGSSNMPLVQHGKLGASEHLIVSPGREDQALFNMPGGQSGNPFSPYYSDGHEAWATGVGLPFLPQATEHRFTISAKPNSL